MRKIKAISLTVTILIMALIFFFSSQTSVESTKVSDGLIMKITEFFLPDMTEEGVFDLIERFSNIIRKTAHFTLFAALGTSVIITVKSHFKLTNGSAFVRAMAVCVAYATTDEIHQLFVAGRTMKFSDILIDSAGSVTGICMFLVLYKYFGKLIRSMKGRVKYDS